MMPLNFADPGKDYTIQRVGGTPAVKKHLEELGFVADGTVQVINTKPHRQRQGDESRHKQRNGSEDHGLSRQGRVKR